MAKKFASHAQMFIEDRLTESEKETAQDAGQDMPTAAPVENQPAPVSRAQAPKGFHYQLVENRSRRFQFMLAPSVFKAASAKAKKQKVSLNEYFNRLVIEDIYGKEDMSKEV